MNKLLRLTLFISGFSVLFLLFLIYTFPFGILKESLVGKISREVGRPVTIEKLSLGLPLRLHAEGIEIHQDSSSSSAPSLKFSKIRAGLTLAPLFIGTLSPWLEVYGHPEGKLELAADVPLQDLLSGAPLPAQLEMQAHAFPLSGVLSYAMDYYSSSAAANPMIAPLLKQLSLQGDLKSEVSLSLPGSDPQEYQGKIHLELLNLRFESRDPNLRIPQQNFSNALFLANLKGGDLQISQRSRLVSEQLDIAIQGHVKLQQNLPNSTLRLTIPLKISGDILDQLGILIQMALLQQQEDWDGAITLLIEGKLGSPTIAPTAAAP